MNPKTNQLRYRPVKRKRCILMASIMKADPLGSLLGWAFLLVQAWMPLFQRWCWSTEVVAPHIGSGLMSGLSEAMRQFLLPSRADIDAGHGGELPQDRRLGLGGNTRCLDPLDRRYGDTGRPLGDQWMYHAVSATSLAGELMRALPEVDAEPLD